MNIYGLYYWIDAAMRDDGKSFEEFRWAMENWHATDDVKARVIRDVVNPKYLPEGFDGSIERYTGGFVLLCYNETNYEYEYRRMFTSLSSAFAEMKKQYDILSKDTDINDKDLKDMGGYALMSNGEYVVWNIFPVGDAYESSSFRKLLEAK